MSTTISPRYALWREDLRKPPPAKQRTSNARVKMTEVAPAYRGTCNEEGK